MILIDKSVGPQESGLQAGVGGGGAGRGRAGARFVIPILVYRFRFLSFLNPFVVSFRFVYQSFCRFVLSGSHDWCGGWEAARPPGVQRSQ